MSLLGCQSRGNRAAGGRAQKRRSHEATERRRESKRHEGSEARGGEGEAEAQCRKATGELWKCCGPGWGSITHQCWCFTGRVRFPAELCHPSTEPRHPN